MIMHQPRYSGTSPKSHGVHAHSPVRPLDSLRGLYPQPMPQPPKPQPLEPSCRTSFHSSLSEKTGMLSLQERSRLHQFPTDNPPRGMNLPALRDVLPAESYPSKTGPYPSSMPVPAQSFGVDAAGRPLTIHPPMVYNAESIHPPMVYHFDHAHQPLPFRPPHRTNNTYQPPLRQPYEGLSPTDGQHLPPRTISPRNGYHDMARPTQEHPMDGTFQLRPLVPNGHLHGRQVHGHPHDEAPPPAMHAVASYPPPNRNSIPIAQPGGEDHGKYLGIDDVRGEGKMHIFEDGYRIPVQVDGEYVNPAWGLTKVNKPRKRLPIACLGCREKKIKCEPGRTSCIQCEKAMRECRRAPEKYAQTEALSNTHYIGGSPVRPDVSAVDTTRGANRNSDVDPVSKRRNRADSPRRLEPSKKQRDVSPSSEDASDRDNRTQRVRTGVHTEGGQTDEVQNDSAFSLEKDPYAVDPELTVHLVEMYFAHVDNVMLPRLHILQWMKTSTNKCTNEKAILYAMLATGSNFAGPDYEMVGKECSRIVNTPMPHQTGRIPVSAIIRKLLQGSYHYSQGDHEHAVDCVGSAARKVVTMHFNTEKGCSEEASSEGERFEFGMSETQLTECKRRLFWSVFKCDRLSKETACMLKSEDVFLRLPCSDKSYESGAPSNAPFFANDMAESSGAQTGSYSDAAPMAWLLPVLAAYGDVGDFMFRLSHRSDATYRDAYDAFYTSTHNRLQEWLGNLPDTFEYNLINLERSLREGYGNTFILAHLLYHFTLAKLNRYVRHRLIPDSVVRNIRAANNHGHQILRIINSLQDTIANSPAITDVDAPYACSNPFMGYVVLAAIDIVSAGGLDSDLRATQNEIYGALAYLRSLERYWPPIHGVLRDCETRYYQVENVVKSPQRARSGCWLGRKWGIKNPLMTTGEARDDCIYGLGEREGDDSEQRYYDAFLEA